MKTQYWIKAMHNRPERRSRSFWVNRTWISDSHYIKGGEPKLRPTYKVGDLLVLYLSGVQRFPAIAVVESTATFDPGFVENEGKPGDGERWGWVTHIKVKEACELSAAPGLGDLGVEPKSMSRRSRLKIDRDQFRAAEAAIQGA